MDLEEVEAQVIEPETTELAVKVVPASITADFKAVESRVRELTKDYEGISAEAIAAMDLDQMKRCRAELNALHKRINESKIAVKKQYESPYKAFEDEVKRILKMVDSPNELVKACIEDKERSIKSERKAHLVGVYRQFLEDNGLPSFEDAVPFDKICERKWWDTTAKSYTPKQYESELADRVAEALREWRSFESVKPKLFDPKAAERAFWETLKAVDAINASNAAQESQQRVDAVRAELGADGQWSAEDERDASEAYVIRCAMTEEQRGKLIAFMKQLGVKGTIRKEQANG